MVIASTASHGVQHTVGAPSEVWEPLLLLQMTKMMMTMMLLTMMVMDHQWDNIPGGLRRVFPGAASCTSHFSPLLTLSLFSASNKGPVQFSCSVVSKSLQPHGLQHTRLACPSPTPGACSNSCPSSQWCHPTISSSVLPFSSYLQSLPASGSFPVSQVFAPGGESIGVSGSASVLPMNIQDWFPLGWTGWISLLSKGLSRFFSNPKVQKYLFFSA